MTLPDNADSSADVTATEIAVWCATYYCFTTRTLLRHEGDQCPPYTSPAWPLIIVLFQELRNGSGEILWCSKPLFISSCIIFNGFKTYRLNFLRHGFIRFYPTRPPPRGPARCPCSAAPFISGARSGEQVLASHLSTCSVRTVDCVTVTSSLVRARYRSLRAERGRRGRRSIGQPATHRYMRVACPHTCGLPADGRHATEGDHKRPVTAVVQVAVSHRGAVILVYFLF